MRTDAAINEGNSGGALFNAKGEIVAIVNAKVSELGTEAMGYALPASNVRRLIKLIRDSYTGTMLTDGTIARAYLSAEVEVAAMPSYWNEKEGRTEIREKITVKKANGSLKAGDIINKIKITDASGNVVEEREVTRLYHITDTLLSARRNYKVTLTVSRSGEQTDLETNLTFKNLA